MTRCSVLLLFIVQLSLAYLQESSSDSRDLFVPDDIIDDNINAIDNSKKSNHFVRFGRNQEKYRNDYDYSDEFAKPAIAPKREKNDHFARFGRNQQFARFGRNQEFLRFGRDPEKFSSAKEMYHRIGNFSLSAIYYKSTCNLWKSRFLICGPSLRLYDNS